MNKKHLLKHNNQGVAILMVMMVISLLSLVLIDFTYESKLNKFKVYNRLEKFQARLNAEAALNFALAKLKIYQLARNQLEQQGDLKDKFPVSALESALTSPFMYPISLPSRSDIIAKSALADFSKNTLFTGSMTLSMTPVSGFLNPNNMRVQTKKRKTTDDQDNDENDEEDDTGAKQKSTSPDKYVEKQLVDLLTSKLEEKKETVEDFSALYGNLQPELLIKELKFYLQEKDRFNEPERAEIESRYTPKDITPKHAPLSSPSELYLLEGWDDNTVALIMDFITVNQSTVILVNEITEDQLKLLFTDITKEQSKDFFDYRDGVNSTEENLPPHRFKSVKDFKELVTGRLAIIDTQGYDTRIKEFEAAGIKLDVAGKTYKITATGSYERASTTIEAIIDLPAKPIPVPKKKKKSSTPSTQPNTDEIETSSPAEESDPNLKEPPLELLAPRVIEIEIN